MGEDRNRDGQFTPKHTDDEVLAAVRAHEPAATSEVAGEIGVSRQAADYRLRRLRDSGRVNSKKIGASLVWFAPDGRERAETPVEGNDSGDPEVTEDRRASGEDRREHTADARGVLDAVDEIPQTVDREAAAAALEAARGYIREHGGATKQDLVRAVMPDHSLGYDVEGAIAKVDTDGERYRGAWWRRVVKPGLEELDDVTKPTRGASTWRYDDE